MQISYAPPFFIMNIFLTTSFSSKILPDGTVEPGYKSKVEAVISVLEGKGHTVMCGMREDGWRLNDQSPTEAFSYDVLSIDKADLVVVLLRNNPISAGTQFELGYTFALKKGMLVFYQAADKPIPYINIGLLKQDKVRVMEYKTLDDVPDLLRASV